MVNKYPSRAEEPSMFELLSGGLEIPVEHDYTKGYINRGDKPVALKKIEEGGEFMKKLMDRIKSSKLAEKVKKDLIYRINKAESQYVSETQDNYRKYNYDAILKTFIYDIFGNPERKNGKAEIKEEEWMNTRYRLDFAAKELQRKQQEEKKENERIDLEDDKKNNKENKASNNKETKELGNNKNKNNKKSSDLNKNKKKNSEDKKKEKSTTNKLSHKEMTLKRSSEANRQKRIDELNKWTRWLPDTAFQTYFGKPAFHAYGKGNINPTVGGVIYGEYMLSHNVNPEHGQNDPQYKQVYGSAMHHGFKNGDRVPQLSRKGHENLEITPSELNELRQRNPIMPKRFQNPDNEDMYTEGSDNEEGNKEDNEAMPINNKNLSQSIPKNSRNNGSQKLGAKSQKEIPDNSIKIEDFPEDIEGSIQNVNDDEKFGFPVQNFSSPNQTPEPGSVEYKRMLEQFIRDPEYVKMVMQGGKDLQNMFPFCFVHNSYGQQLPNHELDPRNYKFLPTKYVNRIAPAGRKTSRGDELQVVRKLHN